MPIFNTVNKHCLNHIQNLTESHEVLATRDICDENGMNLWAKGKPISRELQERLLSRKLREPLELSLEVTGGASKKSISNRAKELYESDPDLGTLLGQSARSVLAALSEVPVESALRLLLSCSPGDSTSGFNHAVKVAMIAAAMALRGNLPQRELEMLVIGALAHDIGELYVNPAYLSNPRQLGLAEWQHVAAHPLIGQKVITDLTTLPKDVGLIIAGHHEREDCSGYPLRSDKTKQLRAGRLVAIAEVLSGLLHTPNNRLARISLALKLVPGEFSSDVLNLVLPRIEGTELLIPSNFEIAKAAKTVGHVEQTIKEARILARSVKDSHPERQKMVERAQDSLARLEAVLHSTGLPYMQSYGWAETGPEVCADTYLEVEMVPREIIWRLRNLARGLSLAAHTFPEAPPAYQDLTTLLGNVDQYPAPLQPSENDVAEAAVAA